MWKKGKRRDRWCEEIVFEYKMITNWVLVTKTAFYNKKSRYDDQLYHTIIVIAFEKHVSEKLKRQIYNDRRNYEILGERLIIFLIAKMTSTNLQEKYIFCPIYTWAMLLPHTLQCFVVFCDYFNHLLLPFWDSACMLLSWKRVDYRQDRCRLCHTLGTTWL